MGGGIAANGRKLSVLFSSYDVWNEENIIQCFKELTPNATTVFEAAWTGKLSLLQEFLKEPDNLKKLQASEFRDGEGRTPLHLASACGHVDCVELLLSKGAEVNVCDGNDNRATPLACAASCGSVQVARVLLNNGADVNSGYEQGKTALHWAIQAGSVECAKILLVRITNNHLYNSKSCNITYYPGIRFLCHLHIFFCTEAKLYMLIYTIHIS